MLAFMAVLAAALLLNGCAGDNSSLSQAKENNQAASDSTASHKEAGTAGQGVSGKKADAKTASITVYYSSQDGLYLVPEVHAVPPKSANAQTALELLLKGTTDKNLLAVIPQGTKLRGVTVKNHIAYADFTSELTKSHGGSQTEILIAGAIVNTLTEFPEIHKVQIMVEGKKTDTIGGHLDTSEPLSRFERLLKKST
jgi:spore germination protein GerM